MKRIVYLFVGIVLILVSTIGCEIESVDLDDSQILQQEDGVLLKGTKIKKKLDICHYDELNGTWITMSIPAEDLQFHLDHGDTEGACIKKVDVCHYDAVNDTWKTMSIPSEELQIHLDHGDTAGACFKSNIPTVTSATGRVWMDRNLGAASVAKSSTDVDGYGDLYQWGRNNDGHQLRTSSNTATKSSIDKPGHGDFILAPSGFEETGDWRNPQNDNLWQGVTGINNPCPPGFRIPTSDEWEAERLSWSSNDAAGAFDSPLKLTMGGFRRGPDGTVLAVDTYATYYSSTVDGGQKSGSLQFNANFANAGWTMNRSFGFSCRCIQD